MQGQDGTGIEIYALSSLMICLAPSTAIDISGYPYLQELHLSEFSQDKPVNHIDILIGLVGCSNWRYIKREQWSSCN